MDRGLYWCAVEVPVLPSSSDLPAGYSNVFLSNPRIPKKNYEDSSPSVKLLWLVNVVFFRLRLNSVWDLLKFKAVQDATGCLFAE